MLTLFRRLLHSRVGVIITLGALAIIALAFAAGDITGTRMSGQASVLGGGIAQVGNVQLTEAEFNERARIALEGARREQPTLTNAQFVELGGVQRVLDQMFNGAAFEQFAALSGMIVSKKSIDGQIASMPAFQGFDGKFNQANYERILRDRRVSEKQLREDIRRERLSEWLIAPNIGANQVPAKLALPYASLLLERREGLVGIVPTASMPEPKLPDDKTLAQYFRRNTARYTVPERRIMRYATVMPARFAESAKATDAEIAQEYSKAGARFAATEKRTLQQVILADQNAANALATQVKGGKSIVEAARSAGLEAATLSGVEKPAYAGATSAAIADAAFAAPRGAVVGPFKAPLGWTVVRVEGIEPIAGKTLAQATPELATEIAQRKNRQAIQDLHDRLSDAVNENATFDELATDEKLEALKTAPLLATGVEVPKPGVAPTPPDPVMAMIAKAGFDAEPGDDPQVIELGTDGSFAIVAVDSVQQAAPPPLAQIRDIVVRHYQVEEAKKAARKIAVAVLANVNRGTPLAQALAATGVRAPPIEPVNVTRAQIARAGKDLPGPIVLMFNMAEKSAKLSEAPNNGGWYIVQLETIHRGDASGRPDVVGQTRQGLGSVVGREYAEQLAEAIRRHVGVKRNEAEIAKLRAGLSGQGGSEP